jgi:glycosyltransferase involved in cell wall biosynthesis
MNSLDTQPYAIAETLHIVEPTLEDYTGHCYSFIESLCRAGSEQAFEVWAGRRAQALFDGFPNVRLHPHFWRRIRKFQTFFLYRQLLRREGRIFVPTTGSTDLILADLALRGAVRLNKIAFFIHWIRPEQNKIRRLSHIARRRPYLNVLGPTPTTVGILKDAGFGSAKMVPYPIVPWTGPPPGEASFRHVLFPGAARLDKGFDKVADLAAFLKKQELEVPLVVQISSRHYGKVDPPVARHLDRLQRLNYRLLKTYPQTLGTMEYAGLFSGAICLQPYDRCEFVDRVSAITLDALSRGAPVVATAGTWIGRMVERFEAGITLGDLTAASLCDAVQQVIRDYPRFASRAASAGQVLQREHHASHLLATVTR